MWAFRFQACQLLVGSVSTSAESRAVADSGAAMLVTGLAAPEAGPRRGSRERRMWRRRGSPCGLRVVGHIVFESHSVLYRPNVKEPILRPAKMAT